MRPRIVMSPCEVMAGLGALAARSSARLLSGRHGPELLVLVPGVLSGFGAGPKLAVSAVSALGLLAGAELAERKRER